MTTQDRIYKLESKLAVLEAIDFWEKMIFQAEQRQQMYKSMQFPSNYVEHSIDIWQRCVRRMNAKYKKLWKPKTTKII